MSGVGFLLRKCVCFDVNHFKSFFIDWTNCHILFRFGIYRKFHLCQKWKITFFICSKSKCREMHEIFGKQTKNLFTKIKFQWILIFVFHTYIIWYLASSSSSFCMLSYQESNSFSIWQMNNNLWHIHSNHFQHVQKLFTRKINLQIWKVKTLYGGPTRNKFISLTLHSTDIRRSFSSR